MVADIEDLDKNLCGFYEGFFNRADSYAMPKGVFTLDDLKELGRKEKMCPYFLARHFLIQSNIIVYNYAYMIDPKISNLVSSEL
jgi:DNA excision repair protein ERCC-2